MNGSAANLYLISNALADTMLLSDILTVFSNAINFTRHLCWINNLKNIDFTKFMFFEIKNFKNVRFEGNV